MKRQLLILAIGFSMAAQAQKAPVFETSAKDEIAANRFLSGSNYVDYDRQSDAVLLHRSTQRLVLHEFASRLHRPQ